MLSIAHLTKRFGVQTAVSDVSLTINAGEIVALIGPNSSGKTTMVRSIVGLLYVDEGVITVDGKDVTEFPKETKSLVGYIPDEPSVWSGMTGEEFLHFTGALYGMNAVDRTSRIDELLPLFSLGDIKKEYFENYSRGNKQKFSIIAALLHNPKLLLVDEPIVGLDPESAVVAKMLFTEFAKNGGAVLLVTHTLPVAQEIAHRIGVVKAGTLLAVGTFNELLEQSNLKKTASLDMVYRALTMHP